LEIQGPEAGGHDYEVFVPFIQNVTRVFSMTYRH
jgi:hypothetical protein